MKRAWGLGLSLLIVGCGGSTADPDGASGGAPPGASGGGPSGGALSTGGGSSSGGGSANGGSSSSGGAVVGTGGSDGECPEVPIKNLLPLIGPFQYGPDPGPCSQTWSGATQTYTYEGQLAQNLKGPTGIEDETYTRADDGRIVAFDYAGTSSDIVYESQKFSEVNDTFSVAYVLDEKGYVIRAERDGELDGVAEAVWTYVYEDCRLVRREAPEGFEDRIYSYDDAGHISSFSDGGVVTTFDYSCW
jgi:hypothetical protein